MGLFGKSGGKNEKEELARKLPRNKKVQFVERPMPEVKASLDVDPKSILTFEAANYYANKYSYLLCAFYFEEDYSTVIMSLQNYVNDRPKGDELFYSADYTLMKSVMRKFGLTI